MRSTAPAVLGIKVQMWRCTGIAYRRAGQPMKDAGFDVPFLGVETAGEH